VASTLNCAAMPVAQRLRDLDRRVLGDDRQLTEQQWRRVARHWRVTGAFLVAVVAGLVALAVLLDVPTNLYWALPSLLSSPARLGYLKSEDDLLRGRQFMGRRRPDGI
jgi:hypothetical protein